MPYFKVFYLEEYCNTSSNTDHRIMVLYDPEESHFYYYGTRNRKNSTSNKFNEYSGSYSYDQLFSFIAFLNYVLDGNSSLITSELYEVFIHEREYASLSFTSLYNKCNNGNILSAYDKQPNKDGYLEGLLNILVCF